MAVETSGANLPVPAVTAAAAGGRRRLPARVLLTYLLSVTSGLLIWELLAVRTGVPYFLPSPPEVVRAVVQLYQTGQLFQDVEISTFRIMTGWVLGILVGVPLGLVMGWWPLVRRFFDPYVEFFRFIPP